MNIKNKWLHVNYLVIILLIGSYGLYSGDRDINKRITYFDAVLSLNDKQYEVYRNIHGPAYAKYKEVEDQAQNEYLKAKHLAWIEYEKQKAIATIAALNTK